MQLKLDVRKQIRQLQSVHCAEQMVQWTEVLALRA